MKLIRPSWEVLDEKLLTEDALRSIELAARTCKKSEKYINETSAEKICRMMIEEGHDAMLEFGPSIAVKFVCDRGVSHEIVRHRLCSFAQESTRYCNYSKDKFDNQVTFIIPSWMTDLLEGEYSNKGDSDFIPYEMETAEEIWFMAMSKAEDAYNLLISKGWQPQQARSILPNSLKTEIVVKANIREWRHIFIQRTSKAAHPQMRELMVPLLRHFKSLCPVVFDDILVEDENLCDNCDYSKEFPHCPSANLIFGKGIGNDNIIKCDGWKYSGTSS